MKKNSTVFTTAADLAAAHSTILAALRHYQATAYNAAGKLNLDAGLHDIATNGGSHAELSAEAIDTLCEGLNCGTLNLRGG